MGTVRDPRDNANGSFLQGYFAIKSYTRSTMDDIQLSDLSVLNNENEFSENLDFNSVVETFAKNNEE